MELGVLMLMLGALALMDMLRADGKIIFGDSGAKERNRARNMNIDMGRRSYCLEGE